MRSVISALGVKKIILLLIVTISFLGVNNTYAAEGDNIRVGVPIDFSSVFNNGKVSCTDNSEGENTNESKYYCDVPKGTTGFQVVMAGIIKFLIFIASLAGVLFIVINGILYSMAGMNDSFKSDAKDRIMKTLIGIILLLMSGVILNILAPWVYG